jgi:hypothetical protein
MTNDDAPGRWREVGVGGKLHCDRRAAVVIQLVLAMKRKRRPRHDVEGGLEQ